MVRQSVVVRAPATTANLGPGYDVMGLALDMWIEIKVERADAFSMSVTGEGAEYVTTDQSNLIVQGVKFAFEYAKQEFPPLRVSVHSDIPFGAGCGSSSAAVVAGLIAGLALTSSKTPNVNGEELLQIAAKIEGHPDNAAPAIYGGLQMCLKHKSGLYSTQRLSHPPNMNVVLFVPTKKMKSGTMSTRAILPKQVSMEDAVSNMSRTALMCVAFSTHQLHLLSNCLEERFHQPARSKIFPHMQPCIDAAMKAGAAYAFLSGAGPTICAFVPGRFGEISIQPKSERIDKPVARAMLKAATEAGVEGHVIVTRVSDIGAHIVSADVSDGAPIRIHRPLGPKL